jgi:hypothetical protein
LNILAVDFLLEERHIELNNIGLLFFVQIDAVGDLIISV